MLGRYVSISTAILATLLCAERAQSAAAPRVPVEIQMRNVNLRIDPTIVLEIRNLRGRYTQSSAAKPVTLDDVNSFVTHIDSAEIAISASGLSDLLNNYVFAYAGAPLKHIVITAKDGKIKQTGVLHKGVDLPFEVEGSLSVTAGGEIRFHAEKVTSAHVPFKGLLHLFGENLSKLVNLKRDRGVTLDGDNILLNPSRMLPPPRIQGRVTAVRIEGDRIVQTFGMAPSDGAKSSTPAKDSKALVLPYRAENYIYQKGGVMRFGKLTMNDTDMELVDQTPATPFDFSLPDYNRQLVAGYSKNTLSHGLVVFMPDFASLATPK